jgi:hypothetical protein
LTEAAAEAEELVLTAVGEQVWTRVEGLGVPEELAVQRTVDGVEALAAVPVCIGAGRSGSAAGQDGSAAAPDGTAAAPAETAVGLEEVAEAGVEPGASPAGRDETEVGWGDCQGGLEVD